MLKRLYQSLAMVENNKNKSLKANNKEERDARLAEALRDNLRRRKQKSRDLKTDPNKQQQWIFVKHKGKNNVYNVG